VSVPLFRRSRAAAVAGLGAVAVLALTGCDLPDVTMSPSVTTAAATSSQAERSATPTTAAAAATTATTPRRRSGDLDSGSLTRSMKAGSRHVVVDYWTDEDAKDWSPEGTKTIQLAAHIEGGGTEHAIKVTRFVATVDDGESRTVAAEDRGEFALTPPYSYTTALTLLPSPSATTELVLYVQFDLLVETEPDSGVFFRQTVLDTLRLPLSEEDSR
jgi:hypothetical protein